MAGYCSLKQVQSAEREEIETSCLILAVACFQVSSGKDTSDLLGLQPKEKQMWELSTRYQIFASSPVGRRLGIAHKPRSCLALNDVVWHSVYSSYWAPLCSGQHVAAAFTAALCGRKWLAREMRREGESCRGEKKISPAVPLLHVQFGCWLCRART